MKERVNFKEGKIIDSNKVEHPFIVCSISTELAAQVSEVPFFVGAYTSKALSLGIAICNTSVDKFKNEVGKKIAEGRARKKIENFLDGKEITDGLIFSTNKGYINTSTVEALLNQEVKYISENPELYIKGWKK